MTENTLHNINVVSQDVLPTPRDIKQKLPLTATAEQTVQQGRRTIENILNNKDKRLFLVVGPCSIHDPEAALDYAKRLKELADRVSDTLYLVMRVYFEKPRTTTGWKGLINDPHLNDSFDIQHGMETARKLLLELAEMGIPTATEALDPICPQYYHDLISWSAIGARTTESQTHREMSSGLSTPVGIKNGTDGNLKVAINALQAIKSPHSFLGINQRGQVSIINTQGNQHGHMVLRGGKTPNYDSVSVKLCEEALSDASVSSNIIIDCSHGNSNKDHNLQPLVMENCIHQIMEGNQSIKGLMLESNLHAGNQKIPENLQELQYGVSVTDACIDWSTTEQAILKAQQSLAEVLPNRR